MQHTKRISFSQLLLKLLCFFVFFFLCSMYAIAQKDTVPPSKKVVTNILNRVTGGNKDTVPKRDVISPNRNVIAKDTMPKRDVINPNRKVVTAKDTVPKREIINPNVINNNNIAIRVSYPDTLIIGAYSIIVESYDKGGVWNNASKIYEQLNGIGRIKFNCPPVFVIWPGLWKDAVLKPVKFRVVDAFVSKENEISVKDAAELGVSAQPGTEIELDMPHYNNRAIDISRYITDIKKVKPKAPEGMRVRFTDCTVSVIKAGASKGTITSGIAKYPTDPAIPPVPFTLNISSGFQLEVSAVSFSPGLDPLVTAKLILPSSLTQGSACAAGRLDLGSFRMTPNCEFYKEYPGSNYGVFGVGNTTLGIEGSGYVVDFSSSQTYGPTGKPVSWKGVVLMQGGSKGSSYGSVMSNIGYMQAEYKFTNGLVESSGLTANFSSVSSYGYAAAQPLGYQIDFANASVAVAASDVTGGNINMAKVQLPRSAVQTFNGAPIVVTDAMLSIQNDMDVVGYGMIPTDQNIYWGDLIGAGGADRKSFGVIGMDRQTWLYFSATPLLMFNPVSASGKSFVQPFVTLNPGVVEANRMQGASFTNFSFLVANTPNIPSPLPPNNPKSPHSDNPVWFRLNKKDFTWMNVVTEGVHCSVKGDIMESPGLQLGDPSKPLYVGVTPFETLTMHPDRQKNPKPFSSILLQCVESAVITCDFRSHIKLPEPVGDVLSFKEMVFTSTANNAGGKLALKPGDSLAYWGLQLVPKPGFSDAGLVSVKTGQIILTAAGLAETRHFAQPFWLTWGEMLANGSMGRLFFDYNSAGQQFDKFNYTHNAVALSPINPDPAKKGFLRVGGTAFFPFFGADYLHIVDTYTPGMSGDPFNGRTVTLSNSAFGGGFLPTDFTIGGNWSDGLGIFNFTIIYAASSQDGFLGTGISALRNLLGGDIGSTLEMNSRGTCIRIGTNLMDQRSISIGPIANISNITRIWGCLCIKNDGIDNLVIGGEVTNAANVSVAARVGSYLSAILQITPSLAKVTIDGEAYMSLALSLDALVIGHMQLTMNWAEGFMEGEVMGKFRVAEGSLVLSGSSLEAEGQLNWHIGIDFFELQGTVALRMMASTGVAGLGGGLGAGVGLGAGFYIGFNAPKERAWVLMSPSDPRYALNTAPLPARLSGLYGSLYVAQSISLFIISGGYELYVGLGAFTLTPESATILGALVAGPGLPYVVGNFGGRIHGEILGGLVSAAAWFNLQIIGPYPFAFQGTVGLEACVLWVICGSVDITVGLNTTEGFYIR
ncbi:MAG: hypothetical protein ACT4OJ_08380 [Bacteroidota bacterium]